jgi:SAM-dependent methyltransferase
MPDTEGSPKEKAQAGVHAKVHEFFQAIPPGLVLDAPAGEGALSRPLMDAGHRVVAVDIAEDFAIQGAPFVRLDLDRDLPFGDAAFDSIACVEGIEHVENPYHLCREFARVLKPGGQMVVSTPNVLAIRSRIHFFLTSYHRRFKEMYPGWHMTPPTYRELKYAFERAGLTIERVGVNQHRKKWALIYPLLKAVIRRYTLAKHPLGSEVATDDVLDGAILVFSLRKPASPAETARQAASGKGNRA